MATVPEAFRLANQLVQLLAKEGFHLTKWISNSREVLEEVPFPVREHGPSPTLEDLPIDLALGTQYDMLADTLSFRVKEKLVADTRRSILSLVSSLYDPLGFAAPLILPAKTPLQELRRLDFGWDGTVPNESLVKWRAWVGPKNSESFTMFSCHFSGMKLFAAVVSVKLHKFITGQLDC